MTENQQRKYQLARKKAGLTINPNNADIQYRYVQILDPYGICPDLPEDAYQVGREYFARARGSEMWVWFGDLSCAVRATLLAKHKHELEFPAFTALQPRKKRTSKNVR